MINPPKFHTPFKQVKGLGTAKDGTGHWIAQRLSGILIAPLGLGVVGWVVLNYHQPYSRIIESLSSPWTAAILFLFMASASYHAALGLQVIVEDYIHSPLWRYWGLIKVRLMGYILPTITLFLLIKIMVMGMK